MDGAKQFAQALAENSKLTTADIAVRVSWYLSIISEEEEKISLLQVTSFIENYSIRGTLNKPRLYASLLKRKDISVADRENLRVHLRYQAELKREYANFLKAPRLEPVDHVLQSSDWESHRDYIKALVRQINLTYQVEAFDACAVMMRRLIEVLIIDAYERKNIRSRIAINGNFQMLSGLIGCITSGQDFKLSRNASKWLEKIKEIGDNAAHSRTYITKQIDIDEFKSAYRNLSSELSLLATT